jgi:quercetin dioxygenase-like cupin family protein
MNSFSIAVLAFAGGAVVTGAATAPLLGSTTVTWPQIDGAPAKGLSRPILKSATATLDELEMHLTRLGPGQIPHPPHSHAEEEVVIIKEGTLEVMQSGKLTRAPAGSVIFQASNQLHGVRNVGEGPASYYVIRWASPGTRKK